ncbi:MAG TPA: FAD-dependent monooxygenase [Chryseolinea sp.]|nr:FAD-dependent monooxygenase [Chryseolinea sp.]
MAEEKPSVKFETDVLIVGSGPAGSSMAALLSTYGIKNVVVTKFNWLARTPRAHITNQRAMEIFRDLGIEQEIIDKGTPQELMGNNIFCTSIASEELGRLHTWGTHPNRMADYTLASPTKMCDIPQNLAEPILVSTAGMRGSRFRFDTEYLSSIQDKDGVTATVLDHLTKVTYQIRAKYLIGADGGNSKVAQDIELPFEGQMGKAGSINIVCKMDLSKYVAHRPSVLYWVLQPGSDVGGIGMGLVRMVRPWNEWLILWGYDIKQGPPKLDNDEAIRIVHNLIGDQSIPVEITSTSVWTVNQCYATQNSKGRIFCVGDAVHRHPPSNGLGSNTSIQDSFNLAWKLALVLKGKAGSSLLDTYHAERTPIAKQIVNRANKSIEEFGPIFDALGLTNTADPDLMKVHMEERKQNTSVAAEQREKLRKAILFKSYEFNCHGVEMNQRYNSSAIVPDGTPEPKWNRDHELYYQSSSRPGSHVPHVWLGKGNQKISTLDLCGRGNFTLFTGIGGESWIEAARSVEKTLGIPIKTVKVGPGCDYTDLYGAWAEERETEDSGCLLIRPDFYVAWRQKDVKSDGEKLLLGALKNVLSK